MSPRDKTAGPGILPGLFLCLVFGPIMPRFAGMTVVGGGGGAVVYDRNGWWWWR